MMHIRAPDPQVVLSGLISGAIARSCSEGLAVALRDGVAWGCFGALLSTATTRQNLPATLLATTAVSAVTWALLRPPEPMASRRPRAQSETEVSALPNNWVAREIARSASARPGIASAPAG